MHTLRRLATAVAGILFTVALAVISPPVADAISVPHGCGQPVVSSNGQHLSLRCTSGRGTRYKITAQGCDSHHCVALGSNIVAYGTTATISVGSGGALIGSSTNIYWYSGSTACLYGKLGGTISWCDMYQNIRDWAARHPTYNQGSPYFSNWYQDKTYRRDCSGLVTMVWHMSTNALNTDSLMDTKYTTSISRSSLRPGDLLDDVVGDHDNHHAVIFAGWNSDHHAGTTDGHFSVWSFGYGTFADDSGHHETHDSFASGAYIAGHPQSQYSARRYVHAA